MSEMKDKDMGKYKGSKDDPAELRKRAETTLQDRTGIVLSGRVVNGKVELDEATLTEIASNFPDANISFVAVNAPFDPKSRPVAASAE